MPTVTALCQRTNETGARFGAPINDWVNKSKLETAKLVDWPPIEGVTYSVDYTLANNGKLYANGCIRDKNAQEPEIVTEMANGRTEAGNYASRDAQIWRQWAVNASIAYVTLLVSVHPEVASVLVGPESFERRVASLEHFALTGSWEPEE